MKVFDGISPNDGHGSIHQGLKAVIARARQVANCRGELALFENSPFKRGKLLGACRLQADVYEVDHEAPARDELRTS